MYNCVRLCLHIALNDVNMYITPLYVLIGASRMGKEPEFTKTVCVRLEPELVETLQALADAEDRTLSQFIRRELKAIGARHAKQSGGQG